jgi:hypothetical protein
LPIIVAIEIDPTDKPKASKRSGKAKFYDGDLAILHVRAKKGETSLLSLFAAIPEAYRDKHKPPCNKANIRKDTVIPYIEAYRESLT